MRQAGGRHQTSNSTPPQFRCLMTNWSSQPSADVQALLEFVEAGEPVQGVANYQDAPPLADSLEAARNRAGHLAETFTLHRENVSLTHYHNASYLAQNLGPKVCCFAPKPRHAAD
jgi:hypothetical protein